MTGRTLQPLLIGLVASLAAPVAVAQSGSEGYFAIRAVDESTGRGIPMVEFRTTGNISLITDSAGYIAFLEPGLMNEAVYFHVQSDGYSYPEDGFGNQGVRLQTTPGGETVVPLKRLNVAERLYRVTGQGIYRDSVLLGKKVPTARPVLNGKVVGQDSVQRVVYRDRIYWFWGDTSWTQYPLGNFAASGAISLPPHDGGLSPSEGINFEYFTGDNGFARAMTDVPGEGVKWLDGLMLVDDETGRERLIARCMRLRSLGEPLEQLLVIFDDERDIFVPLTPFPLEEAMAPKGHPLLHSSNGSTYYYFPNPFPLVRVPAEIESIKNPRLYEGFTCLEQGARFDLDVPRLERDEDGALVWEWKRDTPPLTYTEEQQLVERGFIEKDAARLQLHVAETGDAVHLWGGSVSWNSWRGKWIMIANEAYGSPSFLGEVWYAEAPAPEGPWGGARRIASHREHSFYNPVHHPFFDEEGGRIIYFEGTFSRMFSEAQPTPRYDYNQIMYRLDLSDPRLGLTPGGG